MKETWRSCTWKLSLTVWINFWLNRNRLLLMLILVQQLAQGNWVFPSGSSTLNVRRRMWICFWPKVSREWRIFWEANVCYLRLKATKMWVCSKNKCCQWSSMNLTKVNINGWLTWMKCYKSGMKWQIKSLMTFFWRRVMKFRWLNWMKSKSDGSIEVILKSNN